MLDNKQNQWQKIKLGKVINLQRGFDLPHRLRKKGNIPIVSSSGMSGWHNEFKATGPGVITGRYGTIGEVFYVEGNYWPLNTTLFVEKFFGNNPLFISHLLKTIDFHSHSGKSGVPGVNRNDLHQEDVFLPPLPEQKAIAAALSDVDALITAQEALIAKKRDIKTATMQQLLTGKVRLGAFGQQAEASGGQSENGVRPGYQQTELGVIPEDWELKKLSEIANVKGGKRLPKGSSLQETPNKHPYIRVADMFHGGVDTAEIKYVPEDIAQTIKNYIINSHDLFISVAGTLGIIGSIPESLDGANLTENADKITQISCDKDFLKHTLMSERIQFEIESQKTLGAQPKLALGRIEKFLIPIPPLPEQKLIAEVLSDMDAEITALEAQRDKTRAIKQGMMQELLTGKTRLVKPAS